MPKYHLNNYFNPEPLRFSDISLLQIGRLYFEPGDSVHVHTHRDFYELTIITGGEGSVITNGIEAKVGRGDIYLSLPCDVHSIASSVDSPMKYDFFSFFTDNPEYKTALENIALSLPPSRRVFRDERIGALVCDALAEFPIDSALSEKLLYSIFNQIIIYVIRNAKSKAQKRQRSASPAETVCYQAMNYIDTHIFTMTSLLELSEVMNYNYSYLSAIFKKTTGSTLSSYYQNKRLEVARQILLEGKETVTRVAELLNYSSIYSFSRAFKAAYGITPKKCGK